MDAPAVAAPLPLAIRRLRARRCGALGGALATAAAVELLLAVSVLGALAREESARARVGELGPRERLVQVTARVVPLGLPHADPQAAQQAAERALAGLGLGPPPLSSSPASARPPTSAAPGSSARPVPPAAPAPAGGARC
jgi:hypothetical protein